MADRSGTKLKAKQVENLTEPGTYEDGNGLRLVIRTTGSKGWVLRYQINGKRREMGLGGFPERSLAQAREDAADARKLIRAGIDPLEARKAKLEAERLEEQQEVAKRVTFKTVSADYIEAHKAGWKNAKHGQQWENTLKTYADPFIGELSPAEIQTDDVLKVLKPIWLEKPETASRVRNRIELVLDAAKARGLRDGENPARWRGHLDKLLPKRSKVQAVKHHPALPWADMPDFMKAVGELKGLSFRAIEMTILTACRTSEVLGAHWQEIDLKNRAWTIPAERMKAGKEHRVPLSAPLVDMLQKLTRQEGSPYVFPGMRAGRPLSNMSMLMALRGMERGELTMHGFRSTFRDWAGECTPHPRDVCEQALAHSLGNSVEAAYRRGDLFEKRRALMEDWATYCTSKPAKNVLKGNFKKSG